MLANILLFCIILNFVLFSLYVNNKRSLNRYFKLYIEEMQKRTLDIGKELDKKLEELD